MKNDNNDMQPKRAPIDMVMDSISVGSLISTWVITIIYYPRLQQTIPIHFNLHGEPDGYGNKLMIWLLPAIATIIYVGLNFMSRYKHRFNYPVKVTEENLSLQYMLAVRLLRIIKMVSMMIFSYSLVQVTQTPMGNFMLGGWFIPISLLLVFLPIGVYLIVARRNK